MATWARFLGSSWVVSGRRKRQAPPTGGLYSVIRNLEACRAAQNLRNVVSSIRGITMASGLASSGRLRLFPGAASGKPLRPVGPIKRFGSGKRITNVED